MEVTFRQFYDTVRTAISGDERQRGGALQRLLTRASEFGPAWMEAHLHAMLADVEAAYDESSALRHLSKAVDLGWNDCVAMWSGGGFHRLATSFTVPTATDISTGNSLLDRIGPPTAIAFNLLYRRITVSPADLEELQWLHRETDQVIQEMFSVTVDNIGRVDGMLTEIPQCPVPGRATHSVGVRGARAFLAVVQLWERQLIGAEDLRRNTMQAAVDLIGGPDYSYWDQQRDGSRADNLAADRRLAVARRSFRPSPRLSAVPEKAPAYRRL
ncbi:hypothetical protein ACFVVA_16770 [Kitasatospora sp. NPDC058048]|uniref:hypothetical protein n=1 Tax=Kitasatospora sp. NPDC058048 TaxID=3346313 RepID=UPI0036DB8087